MPESPPQQFQLVVFCWCFYVGYTGYEPHPQKINEGTNSTPWKIQMEPENHLFEIREIIDSPNLHDFGFHVIFQGCKFLFQP